VIAVIAVVAWLALRAITKGTTWTRDPAPLGFAVTGLNFIGAFVILHPSAFRRWPFPVTGSTGAPARAYIHTVR
jgi:hypothetical protein